MSENARRLETAVATTLAEGSNIPTEADISHLASQLRAIPLYHVSDDEFQDVIRRLHQSLRIDMGLGIRVVSDYKPWLQARKAEITPFYWRRYQLSLTRQGWGVRVVNSLDKVTDEILDLCGDPKSEDGWPRRGLVMGDVQSGKTSNYTGLICKAADAGYRLVILLTGTLESLRRQTQGRLDYGFVGLDSSGILARSRSHRDIGVGLIDRARAAGVFTSTLFDFRAATVNQLGFRLDAFQEPVLLVVKKNPRILSNLADWLRNYNAGADGVVNLPMLLVDDEADNASVNTNPLRATTINAAIRTLLNLFPRSSYVGFTATPFANVFIHPESKEDMLGDDLFPRDFVYALDPPTNYIGAVSIFGDSTSLDCLRLIEDADERFPKGHKSNLGVNGLPESLLTATRCFVLANAIMDLRGGGPKHRSMLVNVSHFTEVQEQVKDLLDDYVRELQRDIQLYCSLPESQALEIESLYYLKETLEQEFSGVHIPWAEVQPLLAKAALPVTVRSVNQKSGSASLSYAEYEENGLRVVAVGGNSLSRGLTLEGLCVSYFFRNTQMYDSLLQMGRWFGYRPGYEDLVRIWLSSEAVNWYSHIADASEELRDQIRRMQTSGLRPIDFGMKVRAHPESLLITARNKMRNSSEITRVISVSNEGLETARLMSDDAVIRGNYQALRRTIEAIQSLPSASYGGGRIWPNVPKSHVIEVLRGFVTHPLNITFHPEDLANFIEGCKDPKLETWDIVVPSGSGAFHRVNSEFGINLQHRKLSVDKERRSILVNEKKMRVGSRGLEKAGMTPPEIAAAEAEFRANPDNAEKANVSDKAYRAHRTRPLLALHLLEGRVGSALFVAPEGTVLSALGLSFPQLDSGSQSVQYRINLVEIKNLLASGDDAPEPSSEDDEDDDD